MRIVFSVVGLSWQPLLLYSQLVLAIFEFIES